MIVEARQPGWDAQAIRDVASAQYGGMKELFEAHGWPERGSDMMPAQGRRVLQTYGSTSAFVKAHQDGRELNPILDPMAAIRSDPSQVFLKSFYGFTPETWGFLGYTQPHMRDRFLRESKPGALVVICGTGKAHLPEERLRVLGMQQQTHITGTKWDFLSPERHARERVDADRAGRWLHAVKAVRAWRIPTEDRPFVRDIFPVTHNDGANGTAIGSYGLRLEPEEALAILDLDLLEVPVYGGPEVDVLVPGPAAKILSPSRPGPVSQFGHMVREAEGPKHLYILKLEGDERNLLGFDPEGGWVIKVGFSCAPSVRCETHNRALPACAYEWRVLRSTHGERPAPFVSSGHALAGEQAMKDMLERDGRSLGGEFFLAEEAAVIRAWRAGNEAAENFKGA